MSPPRTNFVGRNYRTPSRSVKYFLQQFFTIFCRKNKFDYWKKSLFFFLKRFPGAKKNRTSAKSPSGSSFITNFLPLDYSKLLLLSGFETSGTAIALRHRLTKVWKISSREIGIEEQLHTLWKRSGVGGILLSSMYG